MRIPKLFTQSWDRLGYHGGVRDFLWTQLNQPHRHYHGPYHIAKLLKYNWGSTALILRNSDFHADDQIPGIGTAGHIYETFVWWHDIVNDPVRNDNEEMSVVEMRLRLDTPMTDSVAKLILMTKNHMRELKNDGDWPCQNQSDDVRALWDRQSSANDAQSIWSGSDLSKYFLLADLAIMWDKSRTYEWYARCIRREYAHVEPAAYRKGRARVIEEIRDGLLDIHYCRTQKYYREIAEIMTEFPELYENLAESYAERDRIRENVNWELDMLSRGELD